MHVMAAKSFAGMFKSRGCFVGRTVDQYSRVSKVDMQPILSLKRMTKQTEKERLISVAGYC